MSDDLKKFIEDKFLEYFECLESFKHTIEDVIKRIDKIELSDNKSPIKIDEEIKNALVKITTLFKSREYLLTPIAEAFHFILSIDTMIEGTKPKSDDEILKYITSEYGIHSSRAYVREAYKVSTSLNRITLSRALKKVDDKLNKMVKDDDEIEDEEDLNKEKSKGKKANKTKGDIEDMNEVDV